MFHIMSCTRFSYKEFNPKKRWKSDVNWCLGLSIHSALNGRNKTSNLSFQSAVLILLWVFAHTEKLLAFSANCRIRRLNSEHCIEKKYILNWNQNNVSLEHVFWCIYIIWFGYLEVPESLSQSVKWQHLSTGSLPITWGKMFYLSRSRPGNIDDGKMRMYGANRSQNNENKCIPRLKTTEIVILCDTLIMTAEPCKCSVKTNPQNCEFLPWRVAREVKWFAQTKRIPWWSWLKVPRNFWLCLSSGECGNAYSADGKDRNVALILKYIFEGFDLQIRQAFPYRKAHEFPGNYFWLEEQILQV